MAPLRDLAAQLLASQRIVTATHCAPDGDGLGCELALLHTFEALGKSVTPTCAGPVPLRFRFLPASDRIIDVTTLSRDDARRLFAGAQRILVVDTHEWSLLGELDSELRAAESKVRFLDHHPLTRSGDPSIFCDPSASSAGEMCWRLLQEVGAQLGPSAATCLYAAIAYDTNMFRYLRSRPETHRIAADLMVLGADTNAIYRHIFASNPPGKLALLGELLRAFHLEADGRLAWTTVTREQIVRSGISRDDLRDLIVPLLEMDRVEIALIFKERADGRCKVSLRSKGRFPVDRIATQLGGGGHAFAAGAHVSESWDAAIAHTLELARETLRAEGSTSPSGR